MLPRERDSEDDGRGRRKNGEECHSQRGPTLSGSTPRVSQPRHSCFAQNPSVHVRKVYTF